jgi:preprotein translocase subunit SecG
LKKNSEASSALNDRSGRAIPVAVLLILVVLLSMGSGIYASASYFGQQASNVTVTTTIYTTTTSWVTSTIWSTVTQTVQGILTTVQYTTSTSTVTVTGSTNTVTSTQTVGGASKTVSIGAMFVYASSFSASASGTAMTVGINVAGAGGSVMTAIYSDNGGAPGSLLGTSVSTAAVNGWNDLPLTAPVTITSGTSYWLAVESSTASNSLYYASAAGSYFKTGQSYGTFPSPFGTPTAASSITFNMRVTYA